MAAHANMFSSLNPNAPDFIPQSYKAVEDFSSEWWYLIQTSPSFREFWTREHSGLIIPEHQELPDELSEEEFLPEEEELLETQYAAYEQNYQ
jgi:hypothetical protein